jgi:hypothetical protein
LIRRQTNDPAVPYSIPISLERFMQTIFSLSNLLVMPFWLLMILAPHWRWTQRVAASLWIVVPVAALYALLVIPALPTLAPALISPSLDQIAALLGTPAGATVAWAHFLAFDLFVGRWAYLESRRLRMSAWAVSPGLLMILLFGPLGLLIFLAMRAAQDQRALSAIR